MKEDLRLRIRKLCTEAILRKVLTSPSDLIAPNSSHFATPLDNRTLQSIRASISLTPTLLPNANDAAQHLEPGNDIWKYGFRDSPTPLTTLDKIVQNLKLDAWTNYIMLLIIPLPGPDEQYKLYVLDRSRNGQIIGATDITPDILADLKNSKVFKRYNVVIGNSYIELNTTDQKMAFVRNLLNTLGKESISVDSRLVKAHSSMNLLREQQSSNFSFRAGSEFDLAGLDVAELLPSLEEINLVGLMRRINNTSVPADFDVRKFFDLAELYEFRIYIRPELCWKSSADMEYHEESDLARFSVECFMVFDNYVGGISLDAEQLRLVLNEHPKLLESVQIINDVCEITPLPRAMTKCMRTLCDWLGIEILYDAFGEFIFDMYKHYVRGTGS